MKGVVFVEKEQARKTGVARLWELASTKKALVVFACVFAIAGVAVSYLPFGAIYLIIRELISHIGDLSRLDSALMIRYGWLACGSAIAAILLNFVALMCSHFAAFQTLYKLKLDFTRHIATLPLGFHSEHSTGRLRKIVDENIEKLEGFIAHQLPDIAGSFATPVVVIGILLALDWRLGLAALVPIVLGYALQMGAYGGGGTKGFVDRYQNALEDMNNSAVEYVRGISVVKAFNQTIYSFRKFHETIRSYTQFVLAYTKNFESPYATFMAITNNIYIFVMPVAIFISGGAEDYGRYALSVIFYLIFSLAATAPFMKLMYVASSMTQIADGMSRMDRILDVQPLPEPASPKTVGSYDIAFEDVSFAYGEAEEGEAVSNVSFTARQGQVTALVGPSGSGKSTLAHLIPRFYDVSGGAIKMGGVDIRDMQSDYLMEQVAFVFQDVFLFKQSIADNLLVANKKATREQVIAAAKTAQCHEFIEKLPYGYDTVIGTQGIHLSGGERQRLVIARAILKDAPIIVLDEATAFADPENEHKIQVAFEHLMKNKTVIIIAHRLSTVRGADKIVVIDNGHIVEQGRHDDLVAANGRYSTMWEHYTSAVNWTITGQKEVRERV